MKVAYITPGVGNSFYCQNCFRDSALLKSLSDQGVEVTKIQMYLPSSMDNNYGRNDPPVFFGAINIYLQEKFSLYRFTPRWLRKILDSRRLLKFISNKTGSTNAKGLEEMTISMLRGEEGGQAAELDKLIIYLKEYVKPEVVHLSNALLLGLVNRIKEELKAKVVCSLQEENEWIELMDKNYQKKIWDLMAEKGKKVDVFLTASEFDLNKSKELLKLNANKIKVINGGINTAGYQVSPLHLDQPVIGYLCRMSEYFGLGILIDAFLLLKQEPEYKNLRLHLTGGYSTQDKKYVKRMMKKIEKCGFIKDVKIFKNFDKVNRISFFQSLTLLSVPVLKGQSFGSYLLESLASGVPVVQPDAGCYKEFVKDTGGGVIFHPNNSENLAKSIKHLLSNKNKVREFARRGREAVLERYTVDQMSKQVVRCYKGLCQ